MGTLHELRPRPKDAIPMYCVRCGRERTTHPAAADPGPCPCGETTRCSVRLTMATGFKIWPYGSQG